MNLEKGSVIAPDNWWYVVVKQKGDNLYCICDNANNIYHFKTSEVRMALTPRQAVHFAHFGCWDTEDFDLNDKIKDFNRAIPVEVIAEVLVGLHDDRFDHWS